LGAIDFFGYIFQLINIKQKADEEVISIKAHLLRLFAFLKLGASTLILPFNLDSCSGPFYHNTTAVKGYFVLLAVYSASCPASFGRIFVWGRTFWQMNGLILCHSFVNEWINFWP
jgi:hypothetical protein